MASEAAGRDFAEADADSQQAVAAAEGILGGRHRGTAEPHAGVKRMVAGKGRKPLQGGRDGGAQHLGDPGDGIAYVDRAPTSKDSSPARIGKQEPRPPPAPAP